MFNLFKKRALKIEAITPGFKIFKTQNITLEYPEEWLTSNEKGIVNLYPADNHGAVTISIYRGIDFPLEKTKEFILDMNQIEDNPENVTMDSRGGITEFNYEHIDNGVPWTTRVLRKGSNMYLITTNCAGEHWGEEKEVFLRIVDSIIVL